MLERNDPLRIQYSDHGEGLRLARQAPPASAASASITYVGPAGHGFDPPGAEGTARIVARLVPCAAGPYGRVALARELDRAGATLTSQIAPESAEITIWGPDAEWESLLELLAHAVLRPRFDEEDLERVLRQTRESQLREQTQPANRAERELFRTIFPSGHPYRETGWGTPRSIGRIDRNRLIRFHREHYTGDGGILVVTAPASLARIERACARRFVRFARSRAPEPLRPHPVAGRRTVREIELADRSQTEIRLGGSSIARRDEHFPAAYLANEILGGRPLLSRLFQNIRERAGLAYHASSDLEAMRLGGYWNAQAGTSPKSAHRVAKLLVGEIDRLRNESVRSRELHQIRESAIGEMALSMETTSDAHELAVDLAYHDLPGDFWRQWPSVLRAIRPREIQEATEIALDGRGAVMVLAGSVE
ncbi:MAG: pitrilysin family protein [Thermoplasmata archaeon]|jgi:zinc protease